MSTHITAKVTRDTVQIYASLVFQIDRIGEVEALTYSASPSFLYNGIIEGIYALRQNDYIVDLNNVDPVTTQAKIYQIINEPEPHELTQTMEFQCMRADRAALTRSS
jgi:hypothetical protein